MATAGDLLDSLTAMDVQKIAIDTLIANENTMASLNEQQMFAGFRNDGSQILPDYTKLTIKIKEEKGQPTDRVTLRDEGDHYAGLYAEVQGNAGTIEYGSTDPKSAKLQKKYDARKGSIYGLDEASRNELMELHVRPLWEEKIERATGLKFD
jgi:hypothetical protein